MIMPSRWLKQWLLFSYYKVSDAPGKIDMFLLLKQDETVDGGWRPKNTLKPAAASQDPSVIDTPGHYRRVTLEVWLKLVDLYGLLGYAIAVWGIPVDDMKRWRVFKNPRVIDINALPPPVLNLPEEDKTKPPSAPPSQTKMFMGAKTVARYGQ